MNIMKISTQKAIVSNKTNRLSHNYKIQLKCVYRRITSQNSKD